VSRLTDLLASSDIRVDMNWGENAIGKWIRACAML
jgi:hypothetical protein